MSNWPEYKCRLCGVVADDYRQWIKCERVCRKLKKSRKIMAKIKIVCSTCGSDDVRRDAMAAWNVDKQEWELAAVMDQGYCEGKCEGECSLSEVEIR